MTEWRLFKEGTQPVYTTCHFFADHPWVDPAGQRGHAARTDMVADFVAEIVKDRDVQSVVDLGCGDGALIQKIERRVRVKAWGYDLGDQNIHIATTLRMVDARKGDFLKGHIYSHTSVDYGELIVCSEVVEHLVDPRSFIRSLPGKLLVLSSPWDETEDNHYEHHAWAWDERGYREMIEDCGWIVVEQRRCREGFQAVLAVR
jgi:2-polyprenyl-3-methyl-5-hydroxy-6-metoxy-1,4-benzoquinol methylase